MFKNIENKIENIQNISLLFISIFSFFSCLYYKYYGISSFILYDIYDIYKYIILHPFDILVPLVYFHAMIDFFVNKSYELKFHHIFVIIPITYNYYYNVDVNISYYIINSLLKTELSSFFYVLKYYLPKNSNLYNINNILFYIAFLKFRIIDMYNELIMNNKIYNDVLDNSSLNKIITSYSVFISINGLYLLNIYWFLIINKIIYKTISKVININSDLNCHYVCSYIYILNIPISIYIYSYNKNEKNILDIIGNTCLAISSYYYHYDVYSRLYNKKIIEYEYPDKNNIINYINDNIFVNLRGFLIVATNYYYNKYFLYVIIISGFIHIISIYNIIINSLNLIISNELKDYFFDINNIINAIPIIFDVIFVLLNSSINIAIPYLLIHIFIGILLYIKPFYKLTHIALHVLLIIQTYYTCLSNIKN